MSGERQREQRVACRVSNVAKPPQAGARGARAPRHTPHATRHTLGRRCRSALLLLAVLGCARPQPAAPPVNTPEFSIAPDAVADTMLAELVRLDSTIVVEMRYATADNFTGAPLPGYEANRAYLRREAAAALARVQRRALAEGYRLKVWDAYRPVRATLAMVDWTRRTGREDLLRDGYIAARSRHNLGLAIDLTLVTRDTRRELAMGTAFDTFSASAHTANATGEVASNRATLVRLMQSEGWTNYPQEWWHFSFDVAQPLRFDRVIR